MIENTILSNLIHNEEYIRKVLPFLKESYFQNKLDRVLYNIISKYVDRYNNPPSKTALKIEIDSVTGVNDEEVKLLQVKLEELAPDNSAMQWLLDSTEKFCQDKAIYNAIMDSIQIMNGSGEASKGNIPSLLSNALAVSFDTHIGHDFLDDYEKRYEFYHLKEKRIPFDLEYFNNITKGGLPLKTLNIALAGCVHPDTKIKVRISKRVSYEERTISISEVKTLLEQGFNIEVESPDGFVPISMFVDKGEWDEYCLELSDGRVVRVNENHLFQTDTGWQYAKDLYSNQIKLVVAPHVQFLCDDGWKPGKIVKTGKKIPIVDIQVEHENHRYYTNGVSSHNTGVGKSLFMCHCAAANMMNGSNVLYITMEMAEEKIAERIDANLLNEPMDMLTMLPKDTYEKKVERIKSKTSGKLIVKEYPTAAAGAAHFRHLINELKLKKNFVPDIIYIDYLNICASSRLKYGSTVNSYTYIKSIAEELRGLAVEFNVPIVSATQTTRSGYTNTDLGLEDTSESFGLPATADFMFALISTEEMENLGQIMVKQLKNRYNDPSMHRKFVVGIDRSKMKLYDVEQSAQEDIIDDKPLFDLSTNNRTKFTHDVFENFK